MVVEVSPRPDKQPKIATFNGTKFATSTQLSERILRMFAARDWQALPADVGEWLDLQLRVSRLPSRDRLLVESFPHDGRAHVCVYGFAGAMRSRPWGCL